MTSSKIHLAVASQKPKMQVGLPVQYIGSASLLEAAVITECTEGPGVGLKLASGQELTHIRQGSKVGQYQFLKQR